MSSETSTERPPAKAESGFEIWHFYILVSMVAATVAVMLSQDTHPAALLLLSAAVIAAGLVGLAAHRAMSGFVSADRTHVVVGETEREALEREKALTLRSIKELEFDRAMGKVSDKDFEDLGGRLRARAMTLIEELDRQAAADPGANDANHGPHPGRAVVCAACQTDNDPDARFCKRCGARL